MSEGDETIWPAPLAGFFDLTWCWWPPTEVEELSDLIKVQRVLSFLAEPLFVSLCPAVGKLLLPGFTTYFGKSFYR